MNEQEREIIQNFRKFIVILKNILTLNTLNSINNDMREDRLMPKGDKYIEFTNFLRRGALYEVGLKKGAVFPCGKAAPFYIVRVPFSS